MAAFNICSILKKWAYCKNFRLAAVAVGCSIYETIYGVDLAKIRSIFKVGFCRNYKVFPHLKKLHLSNKMVISVAIKNHKDVTAVYKAN